MSGRAGPRGPTRPCVLMTGDIAPESILEEPPSGTRPVAGSPQPTPALTYTDRVSDDPYANLESRSQESFFAESDRDRAARQAELDRVENITSGRAHDHAGASEDEGEPWVRIPLLEPIQVVEWMYGQAHPPGFVIVQPTFKGRFPLPAAHDLLAHLDRQLVERRGWSVLYRASDVGPWVLATAHKKHPEYQPSVARRILARAIPNRQLADALASRFSITRAQPLALGEGDSPVNPFDEPVQRTPQERAAVSSRPLAPPGSVAPSGWVLPGDTSDR